VRWLNCQLGLKTRLFGLQSEGFALMKFTLKVVAAAALAIAALSGSAQACSSDGADDVFSHWGDNRAYVLAPDGGFEAGAQAWSLEGGAKAVSGNESFQLHGSADSMSLSLPAGSSAGSPPVCMAIDTPVFRMVARNSGDPASRLRVTARYKLLGILRTQTVATVSSGSSWAPTDPQSTVLTLSTLVGTLVPSSIEIRLTPLDSIGRWQVDDLYIDPFARR
jgi:hypothetical protein